MKLFVSQRKRTGMFVKQSTSGNPSNTKMTKTQEDKNARYPGNSTQRQESFTSASTYAESSSDFSVSPTSVASSDFSTSPEGTSRSAAFSTGAPVLEQESSDHDRDVAATNKYGYEEASPDSAAESYGYGNAIPDDKEDYGYGDSSPDDKTKYGYGDVSPPRDFSRKTTRRSSGYGDVSPPRDFSRKTTRRSSMKQSGRPRRASIQFGGEIEVYLPYRDEPVRRRTSITFNEKVKIKGVTPVAQLTDEPESLWFQDGEYERIKEKAFELVDKVDKHGITNRGKKYCIRGLEKLMPSKAGQVLEHKYEGWDSVLNEQDIQRESGIFDEEYMAILYKYSNLSSKREAAERGGQDEAEIENYLRTTRRMCRRLSM
jgi:hypothetical protein